MRTAGPLIAAVILTSAMLGVVAAPAAADDVADFYRGKQIRLVIGSEASSSFDQFARVVGAHITKYIPGNPIIVFQNMVGAAGRLSANWLFNLAPKDGTALATFSEGMPIEQARKQEGIRFDVTKFNWIGNPTVDTNITLVWSATGVATIDDAKSKGGLICGSSGGSSPTNTLPQVLNNLAGTKIRMIQGYPSGTAVRLAMERGEVNCSQDTWGSIKSSQAELLRDRKVNVLVQWGEKMNPEISAYQGHSVPLASEFAKTDLDRKVIGLINSGISIGRPLVLPPGVPQDRVDALRRAFNETMIDPEFLADAQKEHLLINPLSGLKLQQIATEVAGATDDVLKRADVLMTPEDTEEKEN